MRIDECQIKIGKYHYKKLNGALWLRIFYHNAKLAGPFKNEEALSINQDNKFSILNEIKDDKRFKFEGKYEFLLHYSERTGYNWWRQTNFPLYESTMSTAGKTVEGYENVSVSWTTNNWGGLARTVEYNKKCTPSLLDGSIGIENYFYAIGNNGCTGAYVNNTPPNVNPGVSEAALWIRVSRIFYMKPTSYIYSRDMCSFMYYLIIILTYK